MTRFILIDDQYGSHLALRADRDGLYISTHENYQLDDAYIGPIQVRELLSGLRSLSAASDNAPQRSAVHDVLELAFEIAHRPENDMIPTGEIFIERNDNGDIFVDCAHENLQAYGMGLQRRLLQPPWMNVSALQLNLSDINDRPVVAVRQSPDEWYVPAFHLSMTNDEVASFDPVPLIEHTSPED